EGTPFASRAAAGCPSAALPGEAQGVVPPPLARLRAALALAVRLPGPLDPQVRVDQRVRGLHRRGLAERPAGRVAPAFVGGALGVGAVAVAAGVDDEGLAADLGGELLAVGEGVLGGVAGGDGHRAAV